MQDVEFDAAKALKELSPNFFAELHVSNSRLTQTVKPLDVLVGLKKMAVRRKGTALLIQPGYSGYAWSDRTIPLVFMTRVDKAIRVRVRRGKSYRNSGATPAIWPELRGFPLGDTDAKLSAWVDAPDGCSISLVRVKKLPDFESTCKFIEWS